MSSAKTFHEYSQNTKDLARRGARIWLPKTYTLVGFQVQGLNANHSHALKKPYLSNHFQTSPSTPTPTSTKITTDR